MAQPHLASPTTIGLAEESTYGTAVARTRWVRPDTESLRATIRNEAVPDLSVDSPDSYASLLHYQSSEEVGGEIGGVASFSDRALMMVIKHALGALTTTGGPTYLHTFKAKKILPTGLTVEVGYADKAEIFSGCKVDSFSIEFAVGRPASWRATLIGREGATLSAVPSPSYDISGNTGLILPAHVGDLAWNSLTIPCRRIRFSVRNGLSRRPSLGSLLTLEPVRTGVPVYQLEIECERTGVGLHDGHRARTESDAVVAITDGTRSMQITAQNSPIWEYSSGRDGHVLTETAVFRGMRDTSADTAATLTITNAQSSV